MSTVTYMHDPEFDALVEGLHSLMQSPARMTADRWEIRVALAEHGVLPLRVTENPEMEESLLASLRILGRMKSKAHSRRAAA